MIIQLKRMAVALSLIVVLVGCSSKSEPGPNLGYITPGVGIKEATLGDDIKEVESKLGKPDTCEANPFNDKILISQFFSKGLEISFDGGKVASIVLYPQGDIDGVAWQAYQGSTKEGLWAMSKPQDFRSAWGSPLKELPLALNYTGINVSLKNDGTLEYLCILSPQVTE